MVRFDDLLLFSGKVSDSVHETRDYADLMDSIMLPLNKISFMKFKKDLCEI